VAISALANYSAGQNGNFEVVIHPDGVPSQLPFELPSDSQSQPWPQPTSRPVEPASIPRPPRSSTSLNQLVERFKAQWTYLAPATREKLDYHFKVAARHLDFDRDVEGIKLHDLRVLKSSLSEGRKPSSVNDIIFKALGAVFGLAVEDGVIERSPLDGLRRSRKGEIERQQPGWEESEKIVEEVGRYAPESGVILRLMRDFGVGQAEISALLGEHVNVPDGVIHFRRKKTGKPFDVPVFGHAKSFIESLKTKGRLQVRSPVVEWRNPRKALASACERLGLPIYEPRALRRCFIVHCLENGTDPRLVAKWQGHKDAKLIFDTYGKHIDARYEKQEADKLI
jgi:integrase